MRYMRLDSADLEPYLGDHTNLIFFADWAVPFSATTGFIRTLTVQLTR